MALTRLVNDYKDSVKAASVGANINLGAAPNTLDGVNLAANDRILVKDQSPSYLNGIYRVTTLGTGSNGSWSRSSDFNDWREISPGAMVFVEAGSINGNAFYFINGGGSNVTINTTAINFSNLYSVNGNVTSFPGNVNVAGSLTVVGNIITQSYETVTLTEYANSLTVTGNINLTNSGNINIGAGGNIYMGSTALIRYYGGNTSPSGPNLGDHWYQGNTDILYAYIQDANNNKYWLDLTSNPSSYGNLTVANTLAVNGNLNIAVNSLNVTGGTAGYVLRTDGLGNLSWVAVSATAGGSNTMVQFSDAGTIGGATFLQYNKTSGNLVSNSTTTSTSTATGAIVASSIGISGNVNANAFYSNYYLYSNGSTITTPAGGANTMVQFNDGTNFAGATYIQYNKTSGNLVSNTTTTSTTTTSGAVVLSGGIGVGGNVNAGGYLTGNGWFNESTATPGVYIGNAGTAPYSPRIGFFNGNTAANWQIDNYNGSFRWYTPGVTRMSIDYGGSLTLPGAMIVTNVTDSTSATTGAITVSGGVGIAKALYANNFNGTAVYAGTIGNTSATFTGASATLSGALTLGGAINGQTINGTSILGTTIGNTNTVLYGATHSATSAFLPTANNAVSLANATNYMSSIYSINYFVANALAPIANATVNYGTISAMPLNEYGVNFYVANSILPITNVAPSIGSAQATFKNIYGVSFFGTSTTAKYADLAEMYHADDYYAPGTVMVFGGDLDVTNSKTSHDPRVAGIVSTNPAYLMNDNFEHDNWLPIALTGRVPCLVQGPVQKGDLLVTGNHDGVAQKLDKSKYEVGCIIGKSLDIITDDSIRKIEVAVGRY